MAPTFDCVECEESFSNFRNLRRHSKIHDPNSQFCCQLCPFITKRKDSLKRHSTKYHMANNDETKPSAIKSISNCHNLQSIIPHNGAYSTSASELLNTDQKATQNNHTAEFDKRLKLTHNFIYAGATQSGKTTLLLKTLENVRAIYEPPPSRIYFLHNCFQENYERLKEMLHKQHIQIEFIKKSIVSEADLENMSDQNGGQTLIIIDDNSISAASSNDMAQVFTIARHKNCSIVLLLHFIFGPWASSRIISANTSYFFLLKSPRMTQQISTLGLQLGKQNELVSAYAQMSRQPYGFVLVDLCTSTPDNFRIRTDIFDREEQKDNKNSLNLNNSKMVQVQIPEHVKVPQAVTNTPEKKWIQCSDKIRNIQMKKENRKPKKKHSRNMSTENFRTSSAVHFVNIPRPYI